MLKQMTTSPTYRTAISWAIVLPLCYILSWAIGYTFGSDTITGPENGFMVGFAVGGAFCGLTVGLLLRNRFPPIDLRHVVIIVIGWAIAMFTVAVLIVDFARTID